MYEWLCNGLQLYVIYIPSGNGTIYFCIETAAVSISIQFFYIFDGPISTNYETVIN